VSVSKEVTGLLLLVRIILAPMKEVTEGWSKLCEKLHNVYCPANSPYCISVIKSRGYDTRDMYHEKNRLDVLTKF
jgi:hypothetical protein